MASVTVTYAAHPQFGEPAGLRMEIKGNASWGGEKAATTTTTHGALSLRFGRVPIFARGDRVWFGKNSSGVWLGFDWSDSDGPLLHPAFNLGRGELTYQVNGTVTIDPVAVATTSEDNPPDESVQHPAVYTYGYYWVFFVCTGRISVDVGHS